MRPALLLLVVLTCLAPNRAAVAQSAPQQGRPYYIEYRGRGGGVLGHAYITYGRLDGRGRPAETRYAGFYPRDDYEEALMTFGPLVAAPAYVGVDKKDRVTPPNAVYRRNLTAREYAAFAVRAAADADEQAHLASGLQQLQRFRRTGRERNGARDPARVGSAEFLHQRAARAERALAVSEPRRHDSDGQASNARRRELRAA